MMRGYFYPAGREKLHSLGALDLALWDLKGKALDVPVWQLLGGKSRNHVELYSTVFPAPRGGTLEDAARACRDAGFRTYRYATDNPRERVVDRFQLVRKMYDDCVLLQKGAGDGGWAIDFHTELDLPDAINLATMLPLCSVNALGVTTIGSLNPWAEPRRSALSWRLASRSVKVLSRPP